MKIISYSLYATYPLYNLGAIEIAQSMSKFYPGWTMRVYCSSDAYAKEHLKKMPGVEVVEMGPWHRHIGRSWRFLAASDPQAEYVIFRDADSRFGEAEVNIVNEWIESGKDYHIIRDHHRQRNVILSGMFGMKGGIIKNMKELMDSYKNLSGRGGDELFLADVIWPMAKDKCLEHIGLDVRRPHAPFFKRIPPHPYFIGERVEPSQETIEKYKPK